MSCSATGLQDVRRMPFATARWPRPTTHRYDYLGRMSTTSGRVDRPRRRSAAARLSIGVDPLGGAGVALLGARSPSATASTLTVVQRRTSIRRSAS